MQIFVLSETVKKALVKRHGLLKCLFSLTRLKASVGTACLSADTQKKFELFWELLIDYLCCFQFQWGPQLTDRTQKSPDWQSALALMDQLLQEHDLFFRSPENYFLARQLSTVSAMLTDYLEHEDYLLIALEQPV